jgi:hypothetical protein
MKDKTLEGLCKIFAIFVITLFMTSGVSIDVYAQPADDDDTGGTTDPDKPSGTTEEDPLDPKNPDAYTNPDFYAQTNPDDPNFNWQLADTKQVRWGEVDNYNAVPQSKLREVNDPNKIAIIVQNMDAANTPKLSGAQLATLNAQQFQGMNPEVRGALTTEQWAYPGNLERGGDLSQNTNTAAVGAAIRQRYGLPATFVIGIPEGTTNLFVRDGRLVNGNFDTTGIKFSDLKKMKDVIGMTVTSESPNTVKMGVGPGGQVQLTDAQGNTAAVDGDIHISKDIAGNAVLEAKKGTIVTSRDSRIKSESDDTTITFGDKIMKIEGADLLSSGEVN